MLHIYRTIHFSFHSSRSARTFLPLRVDSCSIFLFFPCFQAAEECLCSPISHITSSVTLIFLSLMLLSKLTTLT